MSAGNAHNGLERSERLKSRSLIEQLFGGGSRSLAAHPLRIVYRLKDRSEGESPVQLLVSVPKRYFKRAVKRNRIKRQVREAYRLNKHYLTEKVDALGNKSLIIAFIWSEDRLLPSPEVSHRVVNLLKRVGEKL